MAVPASRIAEDFGVCTRTIYRDIRDLVDTGTPITGEAGVGYVIDKRYYLPPIAFDADELEAISLGVGMVRRWTDEAFAAKADSAFEKMQAALPEQLQEELRQITTYATDVRPPLPWTVSFSTLRECIRERRRVRLRYVDEAGRGSARRVRPLALVFAGPAWLLAAWCERREDFRHFRLDRIARLDVEDARFDDEGDTGLAAYLAHEAACRPSA